MCSETEEWLYDDGRAADRDAFVAKKKAIEVGQGGGGPSLSSPLSLASLPRLALSPPSLPLSFFLCPPHPGPGQGGGGVRSVGRAHSPARRRDQGAWWSPCPCPYLII